MIHVSGKINRDQGVTSPSVAGDAGTLPEGHCDGRRRRNARHGAILRPGRLHRVGGWSCLVWQQN